MSDLPVNDLQSESADVRQKACTAMADAVDRAEPLNDAATAVVALFADSEPGIRHMATYILQTDMERDLAGPTVAALRAGLSNDVAAVRRGAAAVLAGCLARQEDGVAVAALIDNPDQVVRLATLDTLADGARPRAHTDAVVAALTRALADEEVQVRKEAVWALYLMGTDGAVLDSAVPPLERALEDATTQANAAIALSFAWHTANEAQRAEALYEHPNGTVQMGAAWGAADVYLRRGDLAALKTCFAHENTDVRRGLGAYLNYARQRGRDLSVAGQAFLELQRDHPDDALLHARLFAVQEIIERGPAA